MVRIAVVIFFFFFEFCITVRTGSASYQVVPFS